MNVSSGIDSPGLSLIKGHKAVVDYIFCVCERTTHEFLFGALAELLDNARSGLLLFCLVNCYLTPFNNCERQ